LMFCDARLLQIKNSPFFAGEILKKKFSIF
jgi:hypothetical protein